MSTNTASRIVADVSESDLGLDPDFTAPWMEVLRDGAGWVVGTLFVISGIVLAVGVFMFLVARATKNTRGQETGITALLWGLIGVMALGSIGALLVFVAGFDPFEGGGATNAAILESTIERYTRA